jgi:hypothetical protein
MSPRPSKEILEFMEKHSIDAEEIWQVHGTSWVIKHKALERAAVAAGVVWDRPEIIEREAANKIAVICVFGKIGEHNEWSIGEAAPSNNKNAYPYAMAEKRGKDRVILKLLNAHGWLYSESEADEFASAAAANGKRVELPKKDAKGVYTKLQAEIQSSVSREQLKEWAKANADRIEVLPDDWRDILRLQYEEQLADLRNREVA